VWLAPVQVSVIPVREDYRAYAEKVVAALAEKDIRAQLNAGTETLNKRIRQSEVEKIPYALVVGEREQTAGAVSVRKRKAGDQGSMPLADFISRIESEVSSKALQ
jgi:threonyl-tRNA synthetase